jgi:hypothetical protein
MFKQKNVLCFCLLFISIAVSAQTIKVKKETARVKGEYADGFEVELAGTSEEAESALTKFMKTLGKTKQADNTIVVNEPVIQGRAYTSPVYGQSKQLGNIVSAWVGIRTKDWSEADAKAISQDLEKMLKDFGVSFHREKIQKQIDESIRASQTVERQQQKLGNQNRDLNSKIEDNKREKIQLEKSLVNNKTELEMLIKKLEKNKKDQDSVKVAGEQIKKAIEIHRDRQGKVN